MDNLFLNFRANFTTKIGRCERCMHQSLIVAFAAWGVFGFGLMTWPNTIVQNLIGFLATGLTALWILHVATYAFRAVMAPTGSNIDRIGRRRTLIALTRAVGVGVVASAPAILWSSEVFAFCGQCTNNEDCGVGWSCKNTAAVNSGEVCNECVKD